VKRKAILGLVLAAAGYCFAADIWAEEPPATAAWPTPQVERLRSPSAPSPSTFAGALSAARTCEWSAAARALASANDRLLPVDVKALELGHLVRDCVEIARLLHNEGRVSPQVALAVAAELRRATTILAQVKANDIGALAGLRSIRRLANLVCLDLLRHGDQDLIERVRRDEEWSDRLRATLALHQEELLIEPQLERSGIRIELLEKPIEEWSPREIERLEEAERVTAAAYERYIGPLLRSLPE
jgi:hypothetical protein